MLLQARISKHRHGASKSLGTIHRDIFKLKYLYVNDYYRLKPLLQSIGSIQLELLAGWVEHPVVPVQGLVPAVLLV